MLASRVAVAERRYADAVSLATAAVKVSDCPVTIPPRLGVNVTATAPPLAAVMVMVAVADFVPSVTDVALSVTVAGFGTAPGAV